MQQTQDDLNRANKKEENQLNKELREALEENARLKKCMEEQGKNAHLRTVVDEVLEPLAQPVFGVTSFANMASEDVIRIVTENLETMSAKVGTYRRNVNKVLEDFDRMREFFNPE